MGLCCPCSLQGSGSRQPLKVPPHSNDSMILQISTQGKALRHDIRPLPADGLSSWLAFYNPPLKPMEKKKTNSDPFLDRTNISKCTLLTAAYAPGYVSQQRPEEQLF